MNKLRENKSYIKNCKEPLASLFWQSLANSVGIRCSEFFSI